MRISIAAPLGAMALFIAFAAAGLCTAQEARAASIQVKAAGKDEATAIVNARAAAVRAILHQEASKEELAGHSEAFRKNIILRSDAFSSQVTILSGKREGALHTIEARVLVDDAKLRASIRAILSPAGTGPQAEQAPAPPAEQASAPPAEQAPAPPAEQASAPPVEQASAPPVEQASAPPVEQAPAPPAEQASAPSVPAGKQTPTESSPPPAVQAPAPSDQASAQTPESAVAPMSIAAPGSAKHFDEYEKLPRTPAMYEGTSYFDTTLGLVRERFDAAAKALGCTLEKPNTEVGAWLFTQNDKSAILLLDADGPRVSRVEVFTESWHKVKKPDKKALKSVDATRTAALVGAWMGVFAESEAQARKQVDSIMQRVTKRNARLFFVPHKQGFVLVKVTDSKGDKNKREVLVNFIPAVTGVEQHGMGI